jgi:hypothetical protein
MNASQVGIGVVGPDEVVVVEEEQLTVRVASSSRGRLLLCHTTSHPGSRAISYGKIRHHGRV